MPVIDLSIPVEKLLRNNGRTISMSRIFTAIVLSIQRMK